jgi:copper(I)-binding protein
MKTLLLSAAFAASATLAFAHDFKVGDLTVAHPMAFSTLPTAKTGAGYLAVTNNGSTDDTLLEVRADFPRVMVHDTEIDDAGVARMFHVMSLPIPAGETVTLEPGGKHIMFMGLDAPLLEGQEFAGTLVFETAGELDVMFQVEDRVLDAMDHSEMDHGDTDASADK